MNIDIVVAGSSRRSRQTGAPGNLDTLVVNNSGDVDFPTPYTIRLFATTNRSLKNAVQIGQSKSFVPISENKQSTFAIKTSIPKGLRSASYYLLAAIDYGNEHIFPIGVEDHRYYLNPGVGAFTGSRKA